MGLCITTVLTLSTISLDSRTDLPKVRYATALDWFLLMSFFYCIATLLEFAGVHYFTKVGSGEIPVSDDEDEWESVDEVEEIGGNLNNSLISSRDSPQRLLNLNSRRKNSMICPIYNEAYNSGRVSVSGSHSGTHSHLSTMERTTQTEPPRKPKWKQVNLLTSTVSIIFIINFLRLVVLVVLHRKRRVSETTSKGSDKQFEKAREFCVFDRQNSTSYFSRYENFPVIAQSEKKKKFSNNVNRSMFNTIFLTSN